MTRDEMMLMARLSEAYPVANRYTGTTPCYAFTIEMLESFAYRVAEKELEACAKLCIDSTATVSQFATPKECVAYNDGAMACAKAIRARSGG